MIYWWVRNLKLVCFSCFCWSRNPSPVVGEGKWKNGAAPANHRCSIKCLTPYSFEMHCFTHNSQNKSSRVKRVNPFRAGSFEWLTWVPAFWFYGETVDKRHHSTWKTAIYNLIIMSLEKPHSSLDWFCLRVAVVLTACWIPSSSAFGDVFVVSYFRLKILLTINAHVLLVL